MLPPFAELAAAPDPPLDLLALAMAAELREDVDASGAVRTLDRLGEELAEVVAGSSGSPEAEAAACAALLGTTHGFAGDRDDYHHPDNSMLDLVLERRRGLPILLSVVYVEVARRAGVDLRGVGLPGHFVVGHVGRTPPILIDPFGAGAFIEVEASPEALRPWGAHETAMRMLNNLVGTFQRRGDLGRALRAAAMRLDLPAGAELRGTLEAELRAMRARLN